MARPFDHHLHIGPPGTQGQFPQDDQLLDLGRIGGIVQRAGPQPVAQADGHIVGAADLQQAVEVLIEWIFAFIGVHPVHCFYLAGIGISCDNFSSGNKNDPC